MAGGHTHRKSAGDHVLVFLGKPGFKLGDIVFAARDHNLLYLVGSEEFFGKFTGMPHIATDLFLFIASTIEMTLRANHEKKWNCLI